MMKIDKKIKNNNDIILSFFSMYLNENPRYFSKEEVESFAKECDMEPIDAFPILLADVFQLDISSQKNDYAFYNEYLVPSLKRLSVDEFQNNPYYKTVLPKAKKNKNWEIKYLEFLPYELFVYDEFQYEENGKTLPSIGYFDHSYKYLAVLESGTEWMLITPNEINTMKKPIEKATGHVLTCGLGLGYYSFMAILKDDIESITIIEKSHEVIELFTNEILPFFPHPEKVKIIESDALEYLKGDLSAYDSIFVDLWHDASDGVDLYLNLLKIEQDNHTINNSIDYWIEDTLLNYYKWYLYNNSKLTNITYEEFQDNFKFKDYIVKNKLF